MKVTVYSMENCVQCKQTYMFLDKFNVEYNTVDINKDPNAKDIIAKHDFQSAPVVVVDNDGSTDAWCGFRIDKIKELASVKA